MSTVTSRAKKRGTTRVRGLARWQPQCATRGLLDTVWVIRDRSLPGKVLFTRLAVTPEQIDTLSLPTAPRKATDLRPFEGDTIQAEAIPPDVLAETLTELMERERQIRDRLSDRLTLLIDRDDGGNDARDGENAP
jgi:hypothetical protein